MPLKELPKNLKVKPAPAAGKKELDLLNIEGDAITQYAVAAEQKKAATGLEAELRPTIMEAGLPHIIQTNCSATCAKEQIKSVKLMDDHGSVLRISFTSKYSVADKATVLAAFEMLNSNRAKQNAARGKNKQPPQPLLDAGDYATETLVADFNSAVFLDANGDFDKKKYENYCSAVEKVAKMFQQESPLSATPVLVPKESFHERRWSDFTPEENTQLLKVFRNTISLSPLENMHGTTFLLEVLSNQVDAAWVTDKEFRQKVRDLLAANPLLAVDLGR